MRQHLNQKKKLAGPLGIRTTVWLFVFGLALVCVLIISRHHAEPPVGEIAAEGYRDQDSSPHSWSKVRRTAQTEVWPETYEDRAGYGNGEIDLSMVEQLSQDRRTWVDGPGW